MTAAANLLAEVFGIAPCRNAERIADIAAGVQVPSFSPKEGAKIDVSDEDLKSTRENTNLG